MLGDEKNVLPMGFLKNRSNRDNTPKVIPVVVHIVYTNAILDTYVPPAAIQPAIDQLNVDFEGTNISFELVGYDYTDLSVYSWHDAYVNGSVCFPSYQTQATMLANDLAWDIGEYCNVYVIPKMCSTILGYAYVGYGPDNADDGVWVLTRTFGVGEWPHLSPSHNENEVLTHEAGHYCGLFHTFNNNPGSCGGQDPDIPCEYEGDYVCDTPPTKASSGCPGVTGFYCPTSTYDGGVPFNARNHMDYAPQACRDEFTPGQIERMHAMLEYQRYELYDDDSAVPFCPGDFSNDGSIGTADLLVVLANYGCVGCDWSQGDVTLDYQVTVNDLNWILANWGEICGDGIGMLEALDGVYVKYPVNTSRPVPTPKQRLSYNDFLAIISNDDTILIRVYDLSGRCIATKMTNYQLELNLSAGVYFVELVFTDGDRIVGKFQIAK
jgi:hypothetical protein